MSFFADKTLHFPDKTHFLKSDFFFCVTLIESSIDEVWQKVKGLHFLPAFFFAAFQI